MSAKTQMLAVTTVNCDAPGCKTVGQGPGGASHARDGLNKQGWRCSEVYRTDLCPAHKDSPAHYGRVGP